MEHPFDAFNSNERDMPMALCCSRRMTRQTPPRGRCFTPTAIHEVSARKRTARAAELPAAQSTEPDELLPVCVDSSPGSDRALQETRRDSTRYQSFVRKLSEEVVLQSSDGRIEPAARTRKA